MHRNIIFKFLMKVIAVILVIMLLRETFQFQPTLFYILLAVISLVVGYYFGKKYKM